MRRNREIRFRGKRVDNNEWVCGNFVFTRNKTYIMKDEDGVCGLMYEVDYDTVCQFTGMLDMNGNEIYEGDVVQRVWNFKNESGRQSGIYVGEVRIYPTQGTVMKGFSAGDKIGSEVKPFRTVVRPKRCRVVGNVIDEPDIMKRELKIFSEK
jgi:uncharacterized phage protein (TIGR01671 family)